MAEKQSITDLILSVKNKDGENTSQNLQGQSITDLILSVKGASSGGKAIQPKSQKQSAYDLITSATKKPAKEPFLSKLGRIAESFYQGALVPESMKYVEQGRQQIEDAYRKKHGAPPAYGIKSPQLKGTTGEGIASFAGQFVPGLIGGIGAYGLAGKATAPLVSRIASPLGKTAVKGATAGGILGAAEQMGEGRPLPEVIKGAGIGAGIGAVADPALSKLAPLLRGKAKVKPAPVQAQAPAPKPEPLLLPAPRAQFEAGVQQVPKPTAAALEAPEARLNRVIEAIKPEVERQTDQAMRLRSFLEASHRNVDDYTKWTYDEALKQRDNPQRSQRAKLALLDYDAAKFKDRIIEESRVEAEINRALDKWTPEKAINDFYAYNSGVSRPLEVKLKKGETFRDYLVKRAEREALKEEQGKATEMVDFLSKIIPETPKKTWQQKKLPELVDFAQTLTTGAEAKGMTETARRVARTKGFDLDFELRIADLPPEERLSEMAKRNHWAQIIGLDSETGPLTQLADESFVRALPTSEIKAGASMTFKKQRILQPGTPEWDEALTRISRSPKAKVAVVNEARKLEGKAMEVAQSADRTPKAILATYQSPGTLKEFSRRVFSSVEGWLSTKGQPGQAIITMARDVEFASEREIAQWGRKIFGAASKLTPDEQVNMREVVRGLAKPINEKVANAAKTVSEYYNTRPARATEAGLTLRTLEGQDIPFTPRKDHFPLRLDWKKIEDKTGAIKPEVLQKLVDTGQVKNIDEAQKLLRALRRVPLERHATFQHEAKKIDLPEYEISPLRALRSDIDEAETRIAQARMFGVKDERLIAAVEQLSPKDQEFGLKVADRLRGIDARADIERSFINGLLSYQVISKLGLAAIPNATQNVNTALVTGTKNLIRGIKGATTNRIEAEQFAAKAGIYLDPGNVAKAITEAQHLGDIAEKFLRATGFSATEYWNRLITAQAGKAWADDLFQALVKPRSVAWVQRVAGKQPERIRRVFSEVGINIDEAVKRGSLTEDEQGKMARHLVMRTQFPSSELDVPLWATSPWGKVVFQFKRYAFNQGRLLQRELLNETVRFFKTGGQEGSLRAWGPFLTLYPTAGWMVGAIRDWISGKETPIEKVERVGEAIADKDVVALLLEYLDGYTWVGGLGIVSDTVQNLSWSEEDVLISLLGPTASTVKSALGVARQGVVGGKRLFTGQEIKPGQLGAAAARSAVRGNVPFVGYQAARGELPFGAKSETLRRIFQPDR